MLNHKLSRKAQLFLLGALLGVAIFLLVYGTAPLNIANDAFCRGGYIEKDIQQHYAGWLFYKRSAIGWPLGVTDAVNYPGGVSVAYTDSIPLLAALCRPLAAALGGTFQYFGWFTLVCFALQGGFGALLCSLFAGGLFSPLAGSLVFAASPVLIERAFRHTSLGAQWLVLAALYCYFVCKRQGLYASRGLFLLNVLAVGIHPYFLPMTYAVTLALLLEYAVQKRQWLRPAVYLGSNMVCTAALGWALGLLYGTATSGGQALYGYFAMNLNALWNPVGVNGVLYSRLLPAQNQVGGNYDAFAYLGLGVLAALPVALVPLDALPLLCGADCVCREQRHHGQRRYAGHAAVTSFLYQTVFGVPLRRAAVLAGVLPAGFGGVHRTGTAAPGSSLGGHVCNGAAVGCKPRAHPAARCHAGRADGGRFSYRDAKQLLADSLRAVRTP